MLGALLTFSLALTPATPAPTAGGGATAGATGGGAIQVGDTASHVFATPPWNALCVSSLEDLRGKPVLVDFWGTRCPPCIGAAVPASLKLQETFGDDLQVIFVESQGLKPVSALAFAVAQKWMGGRALWTSEPPFDPGASVLPACVLIGNDGRVLLKGNPIQLHKELERRIAEQIQAQKTPPAGVSLAVSTAWGEFYKGRFGKALDAAEQARADARENALALAAAAEALQAFRARIDARIARATWLLDHGYVDESEAEVDALCAALKGAADYEPRCAQLRARLSDGALAAEREAARALSRLRARFFESGGDPGLGRELQEFAAKNPRTLAAGRALELARLSSAR